MKLIIHTDGGSLNNPGQAAIGFHFDEGTDRLYAHSEAIGIASNNVAEYTALIRAFTVVKEVFIERNSTYLVESLSQQDTTKLQELLSKEENIIESIHVMADSELMVKQIAGIYKVKNPDIRPLHSQIKILEIEIGRPIVYQHILRHLNADADALVKKALGR